MAHAKLSLRPTRESIWKTHEASGAEFEIVPLSGYEDQQITDRCTSMSGSLDMHAYGQQVAPKIIRNWRGVGDATGDLPCNPDNLKVFVEHHCLSIMPWLIRQSRSLEHYRQEEIERAKNA